MYAYSLLPSSRVGERWHGSLPSALPLLLYDEANCRSLSPKFANLLETPLPPPSSVLRILPQRVASPPKQRSLSQSAGCPCVEGEITEEERSYVSGARAPEAARSVGSRPVPVATKIPLWYWLTSPSRALNSLNTVPIDLQFFLKPRDD